MVKKDLKKITQDQAEAYKKRLENLSGNGDVYDIQQSMAKVFNISAQKTKTKIQSTDKDYKTAMKILDSYYNKLESKWKSLFKVKHLDYGKARFLLLLAFKPFIEDISRMLSTLTDESDHSEWMNVFSFSLLSRIDPINGTSVEKAFKERAVVQAFEPFEADNLKWNPDAFVEHIRGGRLPVLIDFSRPITEIMDGILNIKKDQKSFFKLFYERKREETSLERRNALYQEDLDKLQQHLRIEDLFIMFHYSLGEGFANMQANFNCEHDRTYFLKRVGICRKVVDPFNQYRDWWDSHPKRREKSVSSN